MIATLLPKPFRLLRKSTDDATPPQDSLRISAKGISSQADLKARISRPTPLALNPNERPESETSSASGATFGSISEKSTDAQVPCGICRKPFDAQNPQALFAHLEGHFDRRYSFHRCEECQINFVTEADLTRHLHHTADHKSCGYMFQHRQPCTGHHPPRRRELKDDSRFDFCYRLQRWEGTQVEAGRQSAMFSKSMNRRGEGIPAETPATHARTFSMSSISDVMRFSRFSRLPKVEEVEKALAEGLPVEKPAVAPKDALGAALLRAICTANVDLVASFLDAGANIGIIDALGFGVMHYNAQYGSPQIGWLLLQLGADPNATDRRGRSPLSHALSARNTELVHYFLAWGAQPGITELKNAIISGNTENAEMLLEWWKHHAKPTDVLDTLLIEAVSRQDPDMVFVLLDNGARPGATDDSGKTALSIAADGNDAAMVMLLMEHGAEPDGWNVKDTRPLADVVQARRFATAEMAKIS